MLPDMTPFTMQRLAQYRVHRLLIILSLAALLSSACATLELAKGPPLWRIDRHGETLWLFGTVHRLPEFSLFEARIARQEPSRLNNRVPPMPWRTVAVRKAMKNSHSLVLEMLPFADENVIDVIQALLADRPPAAPLLEYLDLDQKEQLIRAAHHRGIDLELAAKADPLLLFALFTNTRSTALPQDVLGADFWLIRDALRLNMRQTGLETLSGRVDILSRVFEAYNGEEQARLFWRYLQTEISEMDVTDADYQRLIAEWMGGDTQRLNQRMDNFATGLPIIHDTFIQRRNQAWMEVLIPLTHNQQDEFVAVGIGHLTGPENLLDLLRAAGFNVDRVQ